MSFINRYLWIALTTALFPLADVSKDDRPRDQPLEGENLAQVQEATRELAREVEYLQEDIVTELSGQKERTLYRQADAVLSHVVQFQKSLKPNAARESLYKEFDELDRKLHELLKGVRDLGREQRLLQRSAARVDAADEQLHYALSGRDTSETRAKQVLARQIRTLALAARQLDQTAQYELGTVQGRGVLLGDLRKLAEASEQFQKNLAAGADRAQLRKDFATVNQAWERAIRGLQEVKTGEHLHLLRMADRIDRLHERLYNLLGIDGKRPQLILRT